MADSMLREHIYILCVGACVAYVRAWGRSIPSPSSFIEFLGGSLRCFRWNSIDPSNLWRAIKPEFPISVVCLFHSCDSRAIGEKDICILHVVSMVFFHLFVWCRNYFADRSIHHFSYWLMVEGDFYCLIFIFDHKVAKTNLKHSHQSYGCV